MLRNWRRIWTLRELMGFREIFGTPVPSSGEESMQGARWKQMGFMKDALQFWLLAKIMLDSKTSRAFDNRPDTGDSTVPCQFDQPSMRDLKQYLGKLGGILT